MALKDAVTAISDTLRTHAFPDDERLSTKTDAVVPPKREQEDRTEKLPCKTQRAGSTELDRQAEALKRIEQLEKEKRALEQQLRVEKELRLASEKAALEKATRPGRVRTALEIVEFATRLTSVANGFALVVRVMRLMHDVRKGDLDKSELARLAIDLAGVFFPPAGAVGQVAVDVHYKESQVFGGINVLWDKSTVRDPVSCAIDDAKGFLKSRRGTSEDVQPKNGLAVAHEPIEPADLKP